MTKETKIALITLAALAAIVALLVTLVITSTRDMTVQPPTPIATPELQNDPRF